MTVTVSVILPVFNGATYLQAALDSVWCQGVEAIQFIVIDDGSTDGTAGQLARDGRDIQVLSQSNRGAPAARNAGLGLATGEFIAFIDADDMWTPGRLQRQLGFMKANPGVDMLQERIQHIRFNGSRWADEDEPFHALSLSAALFRRELFERLGTLDETMTYCDDVEWFLRAERAGVSVVRGDEVALLYRRHETNLTNDTGLVEHYTLRALLKHKQAAAGR